MPGTHVLRRIAVAALTVLLLATGCGGDSSSDGTTGVTLDGAAATVYSGECVSLTGETVTIYSGRSENLVDPILKAFECETGVDVEVRWGGSADLALLLAEEGDRTSADVFLSQSPGPVGLLEEQGLLAELADETLGLVAAENRSTNDTWVGFSGRRRVAVYNVDAVAADELPDSVFDLTGEAWRGRVAIPGTNGSFNDWFTVFRGQFGDDVATEWLNDMVANDAKYYPNNRSIVEAAGRGEVDLGLVNHYYNFQEAAALGDSHRALNHSFTDDDIGSLLIITAATVLGSTDDADTANQLVQYLLSEGAQTYLTTDSLEYPVAAGVAPAEVLPALGTTGVGAVDFDALGGGLERTAEIIDASGIANE